MNKIKYCLVFGVVLLFLGLTVQPITSIEIINDKNGKDVSISDNDCGCNEIDEQQIDELKNDLNRLKYYTRLSLVFLKNNPELTKNCRDLLNKILIFEKSINKTNLLDVICFAILVTVISVGVMCEFIYTRAEQLEDKYPIYSDFLYFLSDIFLYSHQNFLSIYIEIGCDDGPPGFDYH